MNTYNPYEAPKADIAAPPASDADIEQVASAQKLIIFSILGYFAGAAARTFLGPVGLLLVLGAVLAGLVGTFRLCSGLGYSMLLRVILIVLLVLNAKATARLRAAGYHVGLLGATR